MGIVIAMIKNILLSFLFIPSVNSEGFFYNFFYLKLDKGYACKNTNLKR